MSVSQDDILALLESGKRQEAQLKKIAGECRAKVKKRDKLLAEMMTQLAKIKKDLKKRKDPDDISFKPSWVKFMRHMGLNYKLGNIKQNIDAIENGIKKLAAEQRKEVKKMASVLAAQRKIDKAIEKSLR